jgi:hypothetical protein
MAHFIPEKLPSNASAGEQTIFNLLQKLDDDCLVYYEALVDTSKPDFIVIIPDAGVVIIEVKGGYAGHIRSANRHRIEWDRRGRQQTEKHPLEQARGYMFALKDACEAEEKAWPLFKWRGPHGGHLRFPIAPVAAFSNINRAQLDALGEETAKVFPPKTCITRDVLESWQALDGPQFKEKLKACFERSWPFTPLSPSDVDLLRAIIHPEVRLPGRETDIAVLDQRQEAHARAIGRGHRILSGVAGSGKTVILIARAKLLARDRRKRILVLCHNKPLQLYVADALSECENVEVRTFHSWAFKVPGLQTRDDAELGEQLLAEMERGGGNAGRYDAVLVDEGQDFLKSWFQCAKRALKEPDHGDLLIAGDGAQRLRPRDINTWREAEIHARGRTIRARFDLHRNYRNTQEILAIASAFAGTGTGPRSADGEDRVFPKQNVDAGMAVRSGPWPYVMSFSAREAELDFVAAQIQAWLLGGIEMGDKRQPVSASDIAVVYAHNSNNLKPSLVSRLENFTEVVDLTQRPLPRDTLSRTGLRLCTASAIKGLQFKIVVFVAADLLPSDFPDATEAGDRAQLFVALTRAEDYLLITHSGEVGFAKALREIREQAVT